MPRVEGKMWAAPIDIMKAFDSITHKWNLWHPQILRYRTWIHPFLEKLFNDQKATILTDKESDMFDIEKPSKGIHYQACSSTPFCRKHCKTTFRAGKKKRGMGICFGDNDNDCLTDMIFLQTMYLNLLIPKNSFKTCFVTSSAAQKNGTQNTWRKDENPQQPKLEQKKNWNWQHQRRSRCLYEKKNNILAKWLFFISKRRQKTGIASKLRGQHSTNIDKSWHRKLTCWDTDFGFSTQWYHPRWMTHLELGPIQKSMKDWFNATQRKMLRFIIQTKKKYKKIEKRKDKTNENDDTENLGSTEDKKWGWTRFRHVLW